MCKLTKTQPSLLLHPLDFLDEKDTPDLAFFPAMELASHKKKIVLEKVLRAIGKQFEIVPMSVHASSVQHRKPQRQSINSKFQLPIARLV